MSRNITQYNTIGALNAALRDASTPVTLNSLSTIYTEEVLTIPNGKTLTIAPNGTLRVNYGTIINYGTIDNGGTINNNGGAIYNGGTIDNDGIINNIVKESIMGDSLGTIVNFGTINNNGKIDNNSTHAASWSRRAGWIFNEGTINNNSVAFFNNGTIYNNFSTSITTGPYPTGTGSLVGEWPRGTEPEPEPEPNVNIIGIYELNLVLDNWGKPGNL